LCFEILKKSNLTFENKSLFENVNTLFVKSHIDKDLKNKMHNLRRICNSGVHTNANDTDHQNKFYEEIKEIHKSKALSAKQLTIDVLLSVHNLIFGYEFPTPLEYIEIEEQEYKKVLYEAAISLDYELKLKSGLIYESIAKDLIMQGGLVISNSESYNVKSLIKIAAHNFEASYKISANTDENYYSIDGLQNTEDMILQRCMLEPLFKYSILALQGHLGDQESANAYKLIKIAADRGYGPAESAYGALLYEKHEYDQSKKYLIRSSNKDDGLAFAVLFDYYSEGLACEPNHELALKYIHKGIRLGCPDCFSTLGEEYHKGKIVKKNLKISEKLLIKAISLGSQRAKRYYIIEFNELAKQISQKWKKLEDEMLKAQQNLKPKPIKNTKKIGPNEKCPCGSGKKYKKCCRL